MKIVKRRGAWVLDAYIHGRRLPKVYRTKRDAEDAKARLQREREQRSAPKADPFVMFKDYVPRFIRDCVDTEVATATLVRYQQALETHILPRQHQDS